MEKFTVVAVHGLIKQGDKYLFIKRSEINDYKPNEWDIPGGTVEFGETPDEALTREIIEETGLTVEIKKPTYIISNVQDGVRHQFWVVYECEYKAGNVKLNPEEHGEYLWASVKEAQDLQKIYFLDSFYNNCLIK